jgi:hypothetical protein
MKKLLLLFFSISFSLSSFAQWYIDMNFENGADSIITIDTVIMPNNQWQIGTPSKTYFDSAYSLTQALMTDTANPYFGPSVSRSEIKWADPQSTFFNYGYIQITFRHKFDTDTLIDGCSVEFSHDGGLSFIDVNNNLFGDVWHYNLTTGQYIDEDSLPNGKIGLSGNSGGWIETSIELNQCDYTMWDTDTLIIHFIFRANSDNATNKEGWLIDDINFSFNYCESVSEHSLFTSTLYPNPTTHYTTLEFENPTNAIFNLQVFDITGRVVMEQSAITSNRITLNTQHLPAGIYHYRLMALEEKLQSFGKLIIH